MNTHDKYELPPLPVAVPWHKGYDRESLESYARAAVEADRRERGWPSPPPQLTDKDIENFVQDRGMRWNGNYWICEDADLHPMVRDMLYRYTEAPASRTVPSDKEILTWAGEEEFFLFCDEEEFLQIARAVLSRYGQPASSADTRPDYSEMSRETLEQHAIRLAQMLADDKPRQFYVRYALGSASTPSCICCGRTPESVAVQHAEIPAIVVCQKCHDAATKPAASAEPSGYAYRYPDGGIRFGNGGEINGSKPIESIPYWFTAPVAAGGVDHELKNVVPFAAKEQS